MTNKPITKRIAMKRAKELLEEFGVVDAPVDVEAIANAKNIVVKQEPLDDDTSGVLIRKSNKAVIGVNQFHHPNRQRFTIAHELGHYFLHREGKQDGSTMVFVDYRNNKSSVGEDQQEITANAFAAELLMPKKVLEHYLEKFRVDVYDDWSVGRLANKFEVSEQALTLRLINLGYIEAY